MTVYTLATSRTGALALVAVLIGGCSTSSVRRDLDLAEPRSDTPNAGDLMSPRDRDALAKVSEARVGEGRGGYRIGPDDLLDVRIPKLLSSQPTETTHATNNGATVPAVAEAPVFQEGLRVAADGNITLPLLGSVHAAGLTPAQLETEIARRLVAGGILLRPNVSVQIAEHRSSAVAVMGSVERPGLYPLTRPGATIADLIWAAGGPPRRVRAGERTGRRRSPPPRSRGAREGSRWPGERAQSRRDGGRRGDGRSGRERAGGRLGGQARLVPGDPGAHGNRRRGGRRRGSLRPRPPERPPGGRTGGGGGGRTHQPTPTRSRRAARPT